MLNALRAADGETLKDFLTVYQQDFHKLFCDVSYSWWDAMTTGTDEAFEKYTQATIPQRKSSRRSSGSWPRPKAKGNFPPS